MGNRLSKIYTRTGDDGTTGLGDGARTRKDSPRVEALGTIDELNSLIGVMLAHDMPVLPCVDEAGKVRGVMTFRSIVDNLGGGGEP